MNPKFYIFRDVRKPERGTPESAGIDLFIPSYSDDYRDLVLEKNKDIIVGDDGNEINIVIRPGQRAIIPMGVKACIEKGKVLTAHNKTGVSFKKGLVIIFDTIDSDYAGEIFAGVYNISGEEIVLKTGDKLIQVIQTDVDLGGPEFVDESYFTDFHAKSERGEGMLGHTDEKKPTD